MTKGMGIPIKTWKLGKPGLESWFEVLGKDGRRQEEMSPAQTQSVENGIDPYAFLGGILSGGQQ